VFFVTGARVNGESVSFDPARDMLQLNVAAERIGGCRLLIVDPVVSAVTGDSHKNTEVRRALQPLVDLAAGLDCAIVGVSHFSKGTGGRDPTERVVGSVAFGAVARVVLVAAKVKSDDDDKERRILARSKSNIGPDSGGFVYEIDQIELDAHPGIFASRIIWGSPVEGTARELLAEPDEDHGEKSAKEAAEDWLRELLDSGPTPSKTVKKDSQESGYSWATVRRAADAIGVIRRKGGMDAGWYWALPASKVLTKNSKVLTLQDEHLRENLSTFDSAPEDEEAV
jgi:putative DNA primase/helicase